MRFSGKTALTGARSGMARAAALARACEGIARAVRVDAVAPGFTDTSMARAVAYEVRDELIARVPLGRVAQPNEIARAMLFLAIVEASYITSQVLFVGGGVGVGL